MRTPILKRAWRAFGQAHFIPQSRGVIVMAALLLAAANLSAASTVSTTSGGPRTGYTSGAGHVNGDIGSEAEYHTPCGLAMDSSGDYLFVADRDNNAVRLLQFDVNWTYDIVGEDQNGNAITNLFNKPVGIALDNADNLLFVLNRGKGTDGNVLEFDLIFGTIATNLAKITNAGGITVDTLDNIYVTASNKVIKVTSSGVSNVVATITASGASLQGIAFKQNGLLAVCDAGRNGILLINPNTGIVTTNAGFHGKGDFFNANNVDPSNTARFFQPAGVAETGDGTLIVADYGNHRVKRVLASGAVTNLYGVSSNDWVNPYKGHTDGTVVVPDQLGGVAARQPNGVAVAPDGTVYVTEDYYHIIRHVTGAGLKPVVWPPAAPTGLDATAGYGQVVLQWTASSGATNYNIKRSLFSGGPYTNTLAITAATNYTDTNVIDGTNYYYVVSASNSGGESVNSSEVSATPLFSPVPTIFLPIAATSGQVNLTWSTSAGATSYNVKRAFSSGGPYATIGNSTSTSYTDTAVSSGTTYYYVVSALNPGGESANSLEASATPPVPPPPAPRIGWFDYEGNNANGFFTVLYPVSGTNTYTAHNDLNIAIDPNTTDGVSTLYIYTNGPQPVLAVPGLGNGSNPPKYKDGLNYAQSLLPTFIPIMPDLVIKAVNIGTGGSSAIVTAEFLFQVANPTITGNNAALFTVSDITSNSVIWYTIDGTVPTNTLAPPSTSIGPIAITNGNPVKLSINASSNIFFQARAFRNGYSPSGIAVQSFSPANFVANTISFGLTGGEPTSKFLARPGQFFYAPVTLQLIDPSDTMFSLQFNAAVTNGLATPNKIVNGAGIDFFPMLMTQVTPEEGRYYPPADGNWYLGIPNVIFSSGTNGTPISGTFVNTNNNLIGVIWAFRTGFQYSLTDSNGVVLLDFDTTKQDLIAYSIAHDTLFKQAGGVVVLGAYSFLIPASANTGDQYFIQLGSASATRDGAGATGAGIYIQSPANSQAVTVTNVSYLVGDAAPFHWLNVGDFGDGILDDSDVMQVFQSAVLDTDMPPTNSDLYLAMDSSGRMGVYDSVNNYYTDPGPAGNLSLAQQQAMYDGNDLSINTNCFGDGVLDVSDVYVTYRRSEDSSLNWWVRYWTNGQFVAVTTPNLVSNTLTPLTASVALGSASLTSTNQASAGQTNSFFQQPFVSFSAGDAVAAPVSGQTVQVQIPINANIIGNYPLRILGLNITVHPLDGSPALTDYVQFTPSALGQLTQPAWGSASKSPNNYDGVWWPGSPIDSTTPGLSSNVILGTLTVKIPTNATSLSAYAVHFDHASASPNGIISFPRSTLTGVITLSSRTNSTYNDGIPDLWRLRWFGTVNNILSVSNACSSGDGINNWQKYVAGVDPNTPNDFPSLNPKAPVPAGANAAIHWPTVSGKQYVILRSSSLFPGSWSAIATNTGTGTDMEFDDTTTSQTRFYRVQILP
jgi:sugar lactone lactonase YvrE